jgi:hypothetical protein
MNYPSDDIAIPDGYAVFANPRAAMDAVMAGEYVSIICVGIALAEAGEDPVKVGERERVRLLAMRAGRKL